MTGVLLPPKVSKFVLIKKVVDSKLFPPNADPRGGISWTASAFVSPRLIQTNAGKFWQLFLPYFTAV